MADTDRATVGANLMLLIFGATLLVPVADARAQPGPPVVLSSSSCDKMDFLNCDVAKKFSSDFTIKNWRDIEKYIDKRSSVHYINGNSEFSDHSGLSGVKEGSNRIAVEFGKIRLISCEFLGKLDLDKFILNCAFAPDGGKVGRNGKEQMHIALSVRENGNVDYVGFSFPKIVRTTSDAR